MKNEDPIDDLLKRKLEERSFVPQPGDWAAAEQLLNEAMPVKRKKRRAIYWFWLLMVAGGASIVVYQTQEPATSKVEANTKAVAAVKENNSIENTKPAPVSVKTEKVIKKQEQNSLKQRNPIHIQKTYNNKGPVSNKKQQGIFQTHESVTKPSTETLQAFVSSPAEKNEVITDVEKQSATAAQTPAKNNAPEATDSTGTAIAEEKDTILAKTNTTPPDTVLPAKPGPSKKKWSLHAEAGPLVWQPYHTSGSRYHASTLYDSIVQAHYKLDYYAGLWLQYETQKKWRLRSGIFYMQHSSVNGYRKYDHQVFGTGWGQETYTVYTNKLFFAQIPVEAEYLFTHKHSLALATSADVVITSQNNIQHDARNENGIYLYSKVKTNGYRKGYAAFGQNIQVTYSYTLSDAFALRLTLQYGLTDMTRNNYFSQNTNDHNIGLRLGLMYKLKQF